MRGCQTIIQATRWVGRQWGVLFGRVWNGVRVIGGRPAPTPTVPDGPLRALLDTLELRQRRSIETVARQVSLVQSRTPECASVVANLSGDRIGTLRALQRAQPRLGEFGVSGSDVAEEHLHCCCRVAFD